MDPKVAAWPVADGTPEGGLTDEEARARLRALPPPARPPSSGRRLVSIAARQLVDPLVALLLLAAAVSAAIGELLDAVVIAAIVLVNAALGFFQEASAERAVQALRASVQPTATVRRSGRERVVPSTEIVPGDIVVLHEGDRVVADGVLREAYGLEVNESMLTGESVPVSKSVGGDADLVYAGTAVTRGRGDVLTVGVGDSTELAHIARVTEAAIAPPTPLQQRLAVLSRQMVALGVGVTALLTAAMLLQGSELDEAFLVGVSVAVAAVPEGLAATVTITLALAARAMARRRAVVRRLEAAETLGEVSVICTDKTGTLTENRLQVADIAAVAGGSDDDVLRAALLASSAVPLGPEGEPQTTGDPLEFAIAQAARAAAIDIRAADGTTPAFVDELPFDAARRRMTRVWRHRGRRTAYVKGAPEAVLERATLDDEERLAVARQAESWAGEGLRVLAIARRGLADGAAMTTDTLEDRLEVVGLIAFRDPLRAASQQAVSDAHAAGIEVHMLTGDHAATAHSLAAQLGIPARRVAARIGPEDKLRTVERLQAAGHVVAVTGDGVNDAPALRQADVGVSMGGSGTEAAREASDVVVTDDDFSTIVAAIREGRVIADNVRKVTAFLLSANFGEVVLFAVAITAGLGPPMTVIQVLLVNLITDGLPAIALAGDPASTDTMRPRERRGTQLFSRRLWTALGSVGAAVGVVALAAFALGRLDGTAEGQTMAFVTVALAELLLAFSCRSEHLPPWRLSPNRRLVLACAGSAALIVPLVYLPAAHRVLGTAALDAAQVALVLVLAVVPAVLAELLKRVARNRRSQPARRSVVRREPMRVDADAPQGGDADHRPTVLEVTGRATRFAPGGR